MRWKHTGDRAHESRWPPGRTATALITLELLMLGVLFRGVLVANRGDNAYLYLELVGVLLLLASGPFALATLLPDTVLRRGVLILAIVVLAVVALLGAVALVAALLIIPSQDYSYDTRVFGRHLIGFIALIVGLAGVVLLLHCRRPR